MTFPSWIPEDVRAQLDPREFTPYESDLAADADALAARFDVYIATYAARPRVDTHFTHLCRTFASASLSPQALEALRGAEQRHSDVTFVAYAKPLQRQT